jgi:dTDP-4-dehydrorhamnose reductase
MKILITGTDGFLGSRLVKHLSQHVLTCVGKDQDIRTYKTTESFDVIIHCAAKKDLLWCHKNFSDAWDINVNGTKNISNISTNKLIFISSDMAEDTEANGGLKYPSTCYGLTKLEAEYYILKTYTLGGNYKSYDIIRSGLIYDDKVDWIDNCIKKELPLTVYYDRWRNYVHINEVIRVIDIYIQNKGYARCEGKFTSQLGFVANYLNKNNIKYPIIPVSRMISEHGSIGPEAICE